VFEDLFKREKGVIFTYRIALVRAQVGVRGDEHAKRVRIGRFHPSRERRAEESEGQLFNRRRCPISNPTP
jgi:hypothetical protein